VLHGGGFNYRVSRSDAIWIQDNHIAAGGIRPVLQLVKTQASPYNRLRDRGRPSGPTGRGTQRGRNGCSVPGNMNTQTLLKTVEMTPARGNGGLGQHAVGPYRRGRDDSCRRYLRPALTYSEEVLDLGLGF